MAGDRGVILDVDGTLIDSNDAHAAAWVDAAEELGYELAFDQVRPLIGMGGDRVLRLLFDVAEESEQGEALTETRGRIFRRGYLPELEPFPGVRDLLLRLRDDGFDLVVASSSNPDDLGSLLDRAGVRDLIRQATSAGDADESKPHPGIVEAAVGRANVPREGLVMIGDTPYDVEAARRSRIPILAVTCGGWPEEELDGADGVYRDAADLLEQYEAALLEAPWAPRSGG